MKSVAALVVFLFAWQNTHSLSPVCSGVSPGQRPSEGPVRQVGHPVGAARENLDVFRAHSGPLH